MLKLSLASHRGGGKTCVNQNTESGLWPRNSWPQTSTIRSLATYWLGRADLSSIELAGLIEFVRGRAIGYSNVLLSPVCICLLDPTDGAGDCLLSVGPSEPSGLCTTKISVKKRVEAGCVFRGVVVSLVCSTRGIVVVMVYRRREFAIVDGWAWNT